MSTEDPPCGLDAALAVMGGKWKPLILYHLKSGSKRFGDLKRSVAGVSEKVLIQQLRELAAAGVLTRHDYQRVPPMVDYTMTAFRHDAGASVDAALRVGDGASGEDYRDHALALARAGLVFSKFIYRGAGIGPLHVEFT